MRTYSLKPEHMKEYLTLTAEKFHLRTAHSILHGYWTVELGGVNQVVHLWEYGKWDRLIKDVPYQRWIKMILKFWNFLYFSITFIQIAMNIEQESELNWHQIMTGFRNILEKFCLGFKIRQTWPYIHYQTLTKSSIS